MNKKISTSFLAAMTCFVMSGCFDKFDPESYQPAFTIGGYTSSEEIGQDDLIAYWPFDGNVTETIAGSNGTAVGTTFTSGFKGQALKGAMNGYVLADPSPAVLNLSSFTLSMWVNTPPPSTGIVGLFSLAKTDSFWGNIEMFFENGSSNTDGKLRTHLFNGTSDKTYEVNGAQNLFNKWTQLTFTYDGATSTYRLYVNGSKISTIVANPVTGPLDVTNPGKIVFGTVQFMTEPSQTSSSSGEPWASFLTGQLDEVKIYDRVLTDTEINAIVVLQMRGA